MNSEEQRSFISFDGTELFYRAWMPAAKPKGALFLFHRGHEHSGRLIDLVKDLDLPAYAVFAWDARGHGKSPGERGYARHFTDLARDMDCFVRTICSERQITIEDTVVLGHSVAAIVVAQWVHDYAPKIRGMILATPAFDVKLYIPGALLGLRLQRIFQKRFNWKQSYIQSYVKGRMLTHDPELAAGYDSDPLISKQIAANILIDLYDVSNRLLADAGAITTPTLLLSARADWVVKNKPQKLFFNRLSSAWKEVEVYRDFYHAIFHERDRKQPIQAVRRFILELFSKKPVFPDLTKADKRGYTKEEYNWLSAGLPMLSPRRWVFRTQRLLMDSLGRMSRGIEIGWQHGFDSGQSLDHVYRNVAAGKNEFGRLMDRAYLDSIGWRGIRTRRVNLERAIEEVLLRRAGERTVSNEQPLQIFDIAGGPGRYLLTVLQKLSAKHAIQGTIRDWSESGLEEGRELARQLRLENVSFCRADAFDPRSLAELPRLCDLGIVSGLYELFPENKRVQTSLNGIYDAISPGGYLIYTNQPWHPQLEMIAEVLPNREGRPWVMRRRTQAEMDQLVREAGFIKERTDIDDDGIFTVSVAKRV